MDIFTMMRESALKKEAPLASRMRPETLDEIVGQQHILGEGTLLRRTILADRLRSILFFGPPGTGKTSIAHVIAKTTKAEFHPINATSAGKKDMQDAIEEAKNRLGMYGKRTILFIDEIHRFNKAQQDYLLPFVEDGTVILIGATTENPYFEVNPALVSRSMLFQLRSLEKEDIKSLLVRTLRNKEKGLGVYPADVTEEALDFLSDQANGDARTALNALELAVTTTPKGSDGRIHVDTSVMEDCIQQRALVYDKDGDNHYDTISAFIKSMRGSDPDATAYYLARMIYAGEDPRFLARRIMICAAEDVGLADPMALVVATNASLAVERIGMPEARILLSEAALYVATAPKSNASYLAIEEALGEVRSGRTPRVPVHLRDAHYKGAKELGHGKGYKYAHDYPHHYADQNYLPDELTGTTFYRPSHEGKEEEIRKRQEFYQSIRKETP